VIDEGTKGCTKKKKKKSVAAFGLLGAQGDVLDFMFSTFPTSHVERPPVIPARKNTAPAHQHQQKEKSMTHDTCTCTCRKKRGEIIVQT